MHSIRTTLDPASPETTPADTPGGTSGHGRIRCPLCGWIPRPDSRWFCRCGRSWNTFDTGGVCPACLHQWTMTACPNCHKWSRHSDWYPKSD